jgi:TonB family protein
MQTYQPTLIDNHTLPQRLINEVGFMRTETARFWRDFRNDPFTVGQQTLVMGQVRVRRFLAAPNRITATLSALVLMFTIVCVALLLDRRPPNPSADAELAEQPVVEILNFEPAKSNQSQKDQSFGENGTGRVGLREGHGEGSGQKVQRAQGGGSGGDRNPIPPQKGEIPPPSNVLAAIPVAPPVNPPALPVAGIDIDPALWKDLKQPVYGDPSSSSNVPSKGPGEGGGIGTKEGLGIGDGKGPGFGRGENGNTGNGENSPGCCGPGGGRDYNQNDYERVLRSREVEQRARLISKPEPHYTEEARRNQVTGTVKLQVVFSSLGEVTQIRAVSSLPFGLTERAIAAARLIKFVPAMKGGHPVSVHMQLEYNFNLY